MTWNHKKNNTLLSCSIKAFLVHTLHSGMNHMTPPINNNLRSIGSNLKTGCAQMIQQTENEYSVEPNGWSTVLARFCPLHFTLRYVQRRNDSFLIKDTVCCDLSPEIMPKQSYVMIAECRPFFPNRCVHTAHCEAKKGKTNCLVHVKLECTFLLSHLCWYDPHM